MAEGGCQGAFRQRKRALTARPRTCYLLKSCITPTAIFFNHKQKSGKVEELDSVLAVNGKKKDKKFNPKAVISDYIVATENNGFNMDEVLNPGELRLEDLCKELGLIE